MKCIFQITYGQSREFEFGRCSSHRPTYGRLRVLLWSLESDSFQQVDDCYFPGVQKN